MKKLLVVGIITALALGVPAKGPRAQSYMTEYCAVPPFLVRAVPPNIMIVIDVSGSMQFPAYGSAAGFTGYDNQKVAQLGSFEETYDGTRWYYGYFEPDKYYRYTGSKFVENGSCSAADRDNPGAWGADYIPGNLLNWATMSRIDVLRKVLLGGKSVSRQTNSHTLLSDGGTWQFVDANLECTFTVTGANNLAHSLTIQNGGNKCSLPDLTGADVKVDVPLAERTGVVQHIADRDYDGSWDAGAPRFGLMVFAGDNREGKILTGIAGSDMSSFLTALQGEAPYGSTPTGEALTNALDYFEQDSCTYYPNGAYIGGPGSNKDPWLDWCQLSFILLVTDGVWEGAVDAVVPAREGRLGIHEGRNNDLRGDLDGYQVVTTYTVYAFSDTTEGRNSVQQTAIYGGFEDRDRDAWPYPYTAYPASGSGTETLPHSSCDPTGTYDDLCNEWDLSRDGLPDNYYEAQEGSELEQKITQAIYDMLKRAASGTAVSVLSTSTEGEGSLFQAYFNPSVFEGAREVTWCGYLNGLWIDQYGNMREDSDGDYRLILDQDYAVLYDIDPSTGDTVVERYQDSDGDGRPDIYVDTILLPELHPIWEAGKELANTDPSDRTIYTFIDLDGDGVKDIGEWGADTFLSSTASTMRPYLGAASDGEAEDIIRFTRGEHIAGLRDRRFTVDGSLRVWKLGDIVYSTPAVLASPRESYCLIYGDSTYRDFRLQYEDRKTVVFAGANDGMLHAFNGGVYHQGDDSTTTATVERGWYSGSNLGKELWGYIPYNLLPHLKWLADPEYCHVYYVDLEPRLVDARIFSADGTHPSGWGTVLIGGMRFGGGPIEITDDFNGSTQTRTFRSAYFAIDVTDPDQPNLLWEFTDPDLAYTTVNPGIVRVGSRTGAGNWYIMFGSGPTTMDGGSTQTGYIYVLDLLSGALMRKVAVSSIDSALIGKNAFLASPITIDLGLDYQVDVAYIGVSYRDSGNWKGKILRIETNEDTDPANWQFSTFISLSEPVTAPATAAVDPFDRLWILWGTGRYFSVADQTDTSEQRLYGVWDPMTGEVAVSNLTDVTDVYVYEGGNVDEDNNGAVDYTFQYYLDTVRAGYSGGSSYGWYVRLSDGERYLTKPTIIGGIVLFPTFKPNDDICGFGGDSYLYALYYETGTAYEESVVGLGVRTLTVEDQSYKEILKKIVVGYGMATSAAIHAGKEEGVVVLIQLGTGAVKEIPAIPAISPKSMVLFWREQR